MLVYTNADGTYSTETCGASHRDGSKSRGTKPMGATPLTVQTLCESAKGYAETLATEGTADLFGVTDGKAVGTYVENDFKNYIDDLAGVADQLIPGRDSLSWTSAICH